MRARAADHRLHREALDARVRLVARDPLQHVGRRLLRLCGALQSQPHAADVGFMADVVGKDLHHASAVLRDEAGRQCADLGGIARNRGGNGGDAVSDEKLLGFHFRENRAPGSDRRLDRGIGLRLVDLRNRQAATAACASALPGRAHSARGT